MNEELKNSVAEQRTLEVKFASGDMSAMEEIIEKYETGIYHLGLRLFHQTDRAADFCHDVFIKIYEKRHKFNPTKALKPWLFQVAVNLGRDRLRRQREIAVDNQAFYDQGTQPQVEHDLVKEETAKQVGQALGQLSPNYREVLALRFSSDLKLKEIAKVLNINLSAAKVRLCRGLKAFEKAYQALEVDANGV